VKHKTSELTGALLDAAVAMAEGAKGEVLDWDGKGLMVFQTTQGLLFRPSIDWWQGGPIIDRERIMLDWTKDSDSVDPYAVIWMATIYARVLGTIRLIGKLQPGEIALKDIPKDVHGDGPTVLIAAMRAYVASKFGDEVDLP
jgi:hypothetical protein